MCVSHFMAKFSWHSRTEIFLFHQINILHKENGKIMEIQSKIEEFCEPEVLSGREAGNTHFFPWPYLDVITIHYAYACLPQYDSSGGKIYKTEFPEQNSAHILFVPVLQLALSRGEDHTSKPFLMPMVPVLPPIYHVLTQYIKTIC